MAMKIFWNRMVRKFKLGRKLTIRPDNIAMFSSKKMFEGNPEKAETFLLEEGSHS